MGKFKYTTGGGVLTEEQRQFYEDNGYVLIKNNVNPADLDEYQQRFLDICQGKVNPGFAELIRDPSLKQRAGVKGEFLLHKIQNFLYDDVLFKYPTDKAILDVVTSIIGPNITGAHSMLINKPPDADPGSSLHPMHQDQHYFPFGPPEKVVASWTAMEKIDETNGCLYVLPGTHKGPLYPHTYPQGYKNELYHGVQGLDHLPKFHVCMEKGDSIFFHPIILHGSGPNRTKGFRKAISVHFADSNCYFYNVKGTSQENISVEIEKMVRSKGGSMSYHDYWRSKSRLISGPPGNFQRFDSHF